MLDRVHILRQTFSDRFDPSLHILERIPISDRVHKHDPVCTAVVSLSDVLEAFLASSVPDLQFDPFVLHLPSLGSLLVSF
jgi:hypothetical protein